MSRTMNVRNRQLRFESLEDRNLLSLSPPAWDLSFGGRATVGNLSVEKADVATFDGVSASKILDGVTLGIGRLTIDAFARLDDGFVLSFTAAASVPCIPGKVDDSDLVKFDATDKVFAMYLDGSDVGLTSASEDIDAVEVLPDGRIIISTTGSFSVPGVAGKSQDLLAFTPDLLGDVTAGTWSWYLKGSDIGLDRSTENIDGLAIDGDTIYLSTSGSLSALGITAADEDIVSFRNNVASVVFRGADFGLRYEDISAMDLPAGVTDTLHPAALVNQFFVAAFERNPGPVNTAYWQTRTDIPAAGLYAAMEAAEEEYIASAPQVSMTLYAFLANGQAVVSPTGVAEDDRLQARFANIPVGETVGMHLVYDGTIVKSVTTVVGEGGSATLNIYVPNPLLSELFAGGVSGTINVLLVHGDQAEERTLQLREGPRLLLKSAEIAESSCVGVAVRGVTADEPVIVKWNYDWGTGSQEENVVIGRTDGSNRLVNAKACVPEWLRIKGSADRDGIEVDITVGINHRGYKATLVKGLARDAAIAQLLSTSGTDSVEMELRALLTEEERILADNLLGDDWESNAAAIDQALDAFRVQGGGGFGGDLKGFIDQLVPGATQKVIAALLPNRTVVNQCVSPSPLPSGPMCEVLQSLVGAFSKAHEVDRQNAVEKSKASADLRSLAPKDDYPGHLGDDYLEGKAGVAGSLVLAPISGNIRTFPKIYGGPGDKDGPYGPYGTIVAIEATVPTGKSYAREGGSPRPITGNKITVFLGHLDLAPAGLPPLQFTQGQYVKAGQPIGYVGTYVAGNLAASTGGSASDHAHVHVGILPWGIGMLGVNELPEMRNRDGGRSAFPGNGFAHPTEDNVYGTADLIKPPVGCYEDWLYFFS